MLSQRINKDAFALYESVNLSEQKRYLDELENSLALWQKSHQGLLEGSKELGLPGKNSAKIIELFQSIDKEYTNIVAASLDIEQICSVPDYNKDELLQQIRIIQENEQGFLTGMDAIVFQYDAESKYKVDLTRMIEIIILVVTLCTLAMEVLFIFRPAQRQIEKSLEEVEIARDNMEKLFETAPTAMLLIDEMNLRIMKLNRMAKQILSLSLDTAQMDLHTILDPDSEKIIEQLASGILIENIEVQINTADQEHLIVLLSSNLIKYDEKQTILLGLSDITNLKAAEEVLQRYATIDEMTGLLNKRSGLLVLSNLFDHAKETGENLSVCFIDIDGLKNVNDLYGHDEGDWYINTIAQQIRDKLKMDDTVFRYGGDEIVLLLTNCDFRSAELILKKIQKSTDQLSILLKKAYPLQFSYGIASIREESANTPERLLTIADKKMYIHKQKNKISPI